MRPLVVGVPREIKPRENRVGLTPEGVQWLTSQGVAVKVETNAGLSSGFTDELYRSAGAGIEFSAEALYRNALLIQKVKEPQPAEFVFLTPRHYLFCFLHLASPEHCDLVRALLKSGATAIGFETLEKGGQIPLLKPMSEIAGGLSAAYAACFARLFDPVPGSIIYPPSFQSDLEAIAARYPEPPRGAFMPETVIWGGGAAGEKALDFCLKMQGNVTLVENNAPRRQDLASRWSSKGSVCFVAPEALEDVVLERSRIWIGCVHQPGKRAFRVLDAERLEKVSRNQKKIIMDISIDQGGNFPEAHVRTYADPLMIDSAGNLRFSVANIPSLCGPEASRALTKASLEYTLSLARDPGKALEKYPELSGAVNISSGKIVHPAVRQAHQIGEDS